MLEEDCLAQSTTIDVSALSDKIQTLLHDSTLRRQMGRAARQAAEKHFSWPVIVRRYEELWDESIQMAKTAGSDDSLPTAVFRISLDESFGHYATKKRNRDCKCFITTEGREWLKQPARFYFLCHLYDPPAPQRFRQILLAIADHPEISVRELIELLGRKSNRMSTADAHWSLGRLFKYGLVASAPEIDAPFSLGCESLTQQKTADSPPSARSIGVPMACR
jgi:hypothetical protein